MSEKLDLDAIENRLAVCQTLTEEMDIVRPMFVELAALRERLAAAERDLSEARSGALTESR